jgi:putative ATP-dependent endonuclease of the OLD family
MPLDVGVEVISVGALAFRRFLAISEIVEKPVVVVTDNDGEPAKTRERYATKAKSIRVCISEDASLPSLEPQLVASNDLETINTALGKSFDSREAACEWMTANKTEAALRIFDADTAITYPEYIRDAIAE